MSGRQTDLDLWQDSKRYQYGCYGGFASVIVFPLIFRICFLAPRSLWYMAALISARLNRGPIATCYQDPLQCFQRSWWHRGSNEYQSMALYLLLCCHQPVLDQSWSSCRWTLRVGIQCFGTCSFSFGSCQRDSYTLAWSHPAKTWPHLASFHSPLFSSTRTGSDHSCGYQYCSLAWPVSWSCYSHLLPCLTSHSLPFLLISPLRAFWFVSYIFESLCCKNVTSLPAPSQLPYAPRVRF